jgi:hypothetical protein
MAITLYDRREAGDSMLSEDGGRLLRSAVTAIRCFLAEAEEDGPVDLRDLQSVIHSAADDVILNAIITRRLTISKRPTPGVWVDPEGWGCTSEEQQKRSGFCEYREEEDWMHDECIWCGQPEERK